jgi:hypothetical protein
MLLEEFIKILINATFDHKIPHQFYIVRNDLAIHLKNIEDLSPNSFIKFTFGEMLHSMLMFIVYLFDSKETTSFTKMFGILRNLWPKSISFKYDFDKNGNKDQKSFDTRLIKLQDIYNIFVKENIFENYNSEKQINKLY